MPAFEVVAAAGFVVPGTGLEPVRDPPASAVAAADVAGRFALALLARSRPAVRSVGAAVEAVAGLGWFAGALDRPFDVFLESVAWAAAGEVVAAAPASDLAFSDCVASGTGFSAFPLNQ